MAIIVGSGKRLTTDDGIPYMWQSGDVTTTPNEVGILTASDGDDSDFFGSSVAVGSGKIVVGATFDDIGSNYTQGSAHIFDLDGNQLGIITASDGASGDLFGCSVAVGCGRIVVGAIGRDAPYGSNPALGAAYIFDLDGNQLGIITASDGADQDYFGESVAVGCGKIVVGAYWDDDDGSRSGSAYIYDLDGTNEVKRTASDGAAYDWFGFSVAVGCGRIVVGALYDDVGSNDNQGAAYIYDLDGNNEVRIFASDGAADDNFGNSVAVGSGRIVVGSRYADIGANSNQGSAYIFDLDGNQLGILTASDGAANDNFGLSVAVGSGRIVVGSRYADIGGVSDQGAAYIYDLDGNQLGIITASDGAAGDNFGNSVAVGSGRIVIGAYYDDIGANSRQGSAHIYDTPPVYNLYDAIDLNYG